MRKILVVLALLMMAPVAVYAQDKGHGFSKGHHGKPGIFGLDLDKSQQKTGRKIMRDFKRFMIKHHSEAKLKMIDFNEELEKDNPDKKKLEKLIADLAALQAKHKTRRLEMKVEIAAILTSDQKIQFLEMGKGGPGKRRGGGHGRH